MSIGDVLSSADPSTGFEIRCLLGALNANFYAEGKVLSLSTRERKISEEMEKGERKHKKGVYFFHF